MCGRTAAPLRTKTGNDRTADPRLFQDEASRCRSPTRTSTKTMMCVHGELQTGRRTWPGGCFLMETAEMLMLYNRPELLPTEFHLKDPGRGGRLPAGRLLSGCEERKTRKTREDLFTEHFSCCVEQKTIQDRRSWQEVDEETRKISCCLIKLGINQSIF